MVFLLLNFDAIRHSFVRQKNGLYLLVDATPQYGLWVIWDDETHTWEGW